MLRQRDKREQASTRMTPMDQAAYSDALDGSSPFDLQSRYTRLKGEPLLNADFPVASDDVVVAIDVFEVF